MRLFFKCDSAGYVWEPGLFDYFLYGVLIILIPIWFPIALLGFYFKKLSNIEKNY